MRVNKWDQIMTDEASLTMRDMGKLIQLARKRRKMSVIELAKRVGVDRRTISHLEAGNPGVSIGVLVQVLSVLNLARGFTEALKPEHDIDAMTVELRKARSRAKPKKKISDDEVNF